MALVECPSCGKLIDDINDKCIICKSDLRKRKLEKNAALVECPSCGKLNNDINSWCIACKTDLRAVSLDFPVTQCKDCRKLNIGSFQYCMFCGSYLDGFTRARYRVKGEQQVLAEFVADLDRKEALFYAEENYRLNKSLYIRKINEIELQMRHYRKVLMNSGETAGKEQNEPLERALENISGKVKNKISFYAAGRGNESITDADKKNQNPAAASKAGASVNIENKMMPDNKKDEKASSVEPESKPARHIGKKAEMPVTPGNVKTVIEAACKIYKNRFSDNVMFSQLKPEIENRIISGERSGGGITPQQTAYLIVSDVIAQELSKSRECYLFKSVLSTRGNELLRAWNVAAKELLNSGYYSQSEYDAKIKNINDIIQMKDKI